MATVTELLTAEEYLVLPENGRPTELVRGRIVEVNLPAARHGQIMAKIVRILGAYLDVHDLGELTCGDAGVITQRDPDTVRGGDVQFYSYERIPRGPFPTGYLPVTPELIFQIRSPTDRWRDIHAKIGEYLSAGVKVVCVFEQQTESAYLFFADEPGVVLRSDDEFSLPDILGDFRVRVGKFFE